MKTIFTFILLSLFSLNLHAEAHKWIDEEGKVNYSDIPPPHVESPQTIRNIAGKGQTEAPASYSNKSYAEREAELKKSKKEQAEVSSKKANEAAQAEEKKHNCVAARENLRTLEDGARVTGYDANGERTYLDDSAREQRLNEARKAISVNCD